MGLDSGGDGWRQGLGHESVTLSRNRDDEPVIAAFFAEGLAKRGHVNGKVIFLNDLIVPHQLEQTIFGQQLTTVPGERDEQVKRF